MARAKQGLEHFPLDVDVDSDQKVELIEAEFGLKGFAIMIKLWARIYDEGYYYKWDSDIKLIFAKKYAGGNTGLVDEVVRGCVKRGLLDEHMLNRFEILTSEKIQNKYLDIVNRLKRSQIKVIEEYLLVDPSTLDLNIPLEKRSLSSGKSGDSSGELPENSESSTTREGKVRESKVREGKVNTNTHVEPPDSPEPDAYPDVCEYLEEAEWLAKRLLEGILHYKPDHKFSKSPPAINSWVLAIERMIRLDGRKPKHIKRVIDYTFTKDAKQAQFWAKNIWSGKKLRDKYDRLVSDYKDENESNKQTNGEINTEKLAKQLDEIYN